MGSPHTRARGRASSPPLPACQDPLALQPRQQLLLDLDLGLLPQLMAPLFQDLIDLPLPDLPPDDLLHL